MAKQGFLVLLKRVFDDHKKSAAVMRKACAAAGNLAWNGENVVSCELEERDDVS